MLGLKSRHGNASAFVASYLTKGAQYGGEHVSCKHCGKLRHEETNCVKLIGYPTGWADVAAGTEEGVVEEDEEPTHTEANEDILGRSKSMRPRPKRAATLLLGQKTIDNPCPKSLKTKYRNC